MTLDFIGNLVSGPAVAALAEVFRQSLLMLTKYAWMLCLNLTTVAKTFNI